MRSAYLVVVLALSCMASSDARPAVAQPRPSHERRHARRPCSRELGGQPLTDTERDARARCDLTCEEVARSRRMNEGPVVWCMNGHYRRPARPH